MPLIGNSKQNKENTKHNIMITKSKILIVSGVLTSFIALTAFKTLVEKKDFLILRTIEAHRTVFIPCAMIVSKPDGTTESVELKRYTKDTDNTIDNMKTVTRKIAEIQSMGYELKDFSGGGDVSGTVYTYYFEK